MVVQEVDLVDVEDVAVGLGQDAGLEAARALLERRLQVDRPHHPVLRRVDRELDHAHPPLRAGQRVLAVVEAQAAVGAEGLLVLRVAAEVAALDHVLLREESRERADGGGLRGALLAADQHAADRGVDGVQDQGELHPLLADDRGEGEGIAL